MPRGRWRRMDRGRLSCVESGHVNISFDVLDLLHWERRRKKGEKVRWSGREGRSEEGVKMSMRGGIISVTRDHPRESMGSNG